MKQQIEAIYETMKQQAYEEMYEHGLEQARKMKRNVALNFAETDIVLWIDRTEKMLADKSHWRDDDSSRASYAYYQSLVQDAYAAVRWINMRQLEINPD